MLKFIFRRILMMVPVIIGITLFIYFIMDIAPGDPARLILGADATPEAIVAKRAELGLNQPLLVRYAGYMLGILRGDLGVSWFNNYNVLSEFLARLPNTLTLGLLSMAIAALLGIPLGILAAVNQYHTLDYVTLAGAMIFASMPAFWFGLMAQVYLALQLGWLPATGVGSVSHFILPSITLAAASLASQVRMTRTSMLEVMKQDYVRTARAKGAPELRVILVHVLRNGMLPVVTQLGIGFAVLLGGAIVTETVFAIPGVASLLLNAVKLRDVPVVMGIILIIAVFVGVINLLVDLLYAVIDPRVKSAYGA
jgi:peptide/nickel transport system permease protein